MPILGKAPVNYLIGSTRLNSELSNARMERNITGKKIKPAANPSLLSKLRAKPISASMMNTKPIPGIKPCTL